MVTGATHGENDCNYGAARYSAEGIYQITHYVFMLNTERHVEMRMLRRFSDVKRPETTSGFEVKHTNL